MSEATCGHSGSSFQNPAAFDYNNHDQTALCPECDQRVAVQPMRAGQRIDGIKFATHTEPEQQQSKT
ncbi:MAG TPA: hypothetical protein VN840_16895 [Streptosporangiaceae bacterium]|nr:hypothetical protein [Streptosporangiaceae bacterium]